MNVQHYSMGVHKYPTDNSTEMNKKGKKLHANAGSLILYIYPKYSGKYTDREFYFLLSVFMKVLLGLPLRL